MGTSLDVDPAVSRSSVSGSARVFRLASWLKPDNTAHTSKHNQYIILNNLQFCEYTPSPLAEKNAQRNQLQNYIIQCLSTVRLYLCVS